MLIALLISCKAQREKPQNSTLSAAKTLTSYRHKKIFPFGRAYIFLADATNDQAWITEEHAQSLLTFILRLNRLGFEVVVNHIPNKNQIRLALFDPKISSFYYIGHGDADGCLTTYNRGNKLPKNTFEVTKPVANLKFGFFGACFGANAKKYYGLDNKDFFPNLVSKGPQEKFANTAIFDFLNGAKFLGRLSEAFGDEILNDN